MSVSSTNLFRKAKELSISPEFKAYTGVRIYTGTQDENGADIVYEAGDLDSGRVLEIENEWGTQAQANNILATINGWQYKPYDASGAILDPSAELNDGVTVNDVYSGICSKIIHFGTLMDSDIAAPHDEEVDYEYTFQTSEERKITRQTKEFRSEFKIQASKIAARVESSGGNSSSFGWILTDHSHEWYSNNSLVMEVNSTGLRVNGLIEAVEFRTSAGQTLATTAQLESIRAATYSGMTGGNGFLGAMNSALKLGNNTQNGKNGSQVTKLNYVYAANGQYDYLSALGTDDLDDCGVSAISIGCAYLYVNGSKAAWKSTSFYAVDDDEVDIYDGNGRYVGSGSISVRTVSLGYLG